MRLEVGALKTVVFGLLFLLPKECLIVPFWHHANLLVNIGNLLQKLKRQVVIKESIKNPKLNHSII